MTLQLTPRELFALNCARGVDPETGDTTKSGKAPTIKQYNSLIARGKLLGALLVKPAGQNF